MILSGFSHHGARRLASLAVVALILVASWQPALAQDDSPVDVRGSDLRARTAREDHIFRLVWTILRRHRSYVCSYERDRATQRWRLLTLSQEKHSQTIILEALPWSKRLR